MRIKVLLIFFGIVLACTGDGWTAQDKKARENANGWSAFDIGSWVIVQEKWNLGGEVTSKRRKSIVKGFDLTSIHVEEKPELDGNFVDKGITVFHSYRLTFQANGFEEAKPRKETLEVAGKKFDCRVIEFNHTKKDPFVTAKIVIWKTGTVKVPYREIPQDANLALPSDCVKVQLAFQDAQKRSKSYTGIVDEFGSKLKVGNQELKCVVEKWVIEEDDPKSGKAQFNARVWLSDEVPGCEVKLQITGKLAGKAAELDRFVVDYGAIRKRN